MNSDNFKNSRRLIRLLRGGIRKILRRPEAGYKSETSKCRARLAPFCAGYGLDLGFGGDPITEQSIRIDLPQPYAYTGSAPVQLGGDAAHLHWFQDGVLDYVYSSHLLEDFPDTEAVLREWLRVLRPGGNLVIFCPDEEMYLTYCRRARLMHNENHRHADFSLPKVREILRRIGGVTFIHENPLVDIYSWELVAQKVDR